MDLTKKRRLDENGGVVLDAITDYSLTTKLTPVDARKMMERFTHEQLLDVLQDAVVRHPDVLDAVRSVADSDITQRKLFVRGLGWETTTESLRSLFSAYGQLEEAVVILDKNTGKSKGYGFVIFKHVDGALLALKEPSKKIDGRVTVTQLASAGANSNSNSNSNNSSSNHPAGADVSMRKIYVGNVPYEMPADKLLGIFAQYGEIEEGPLGFDKQTGKSKGFALFVYKTPEGAQAALLEPDKLIDGRRLNCKLAIDGKKGKPAGGGGGQVPGGNVFGDGMGMGYGHQGPYAAPLLQTGGMGSYSGFSGGPPPLAGNQLNTSLGGPGFGSHSQPQGSGYGGAGVGAAYGGYGSGTGGPGYGGFGSGGAGFASATGLSVGPFTGGSSVYRFPPSSVGMPSGGYQEAGPYSLSSTSGPFPTQHQGTSPAPRVPSGGMYPHLPPYH